MLNVADPFYNYSSPSLLSQQPDEAPYLPVNEWPTIQQKLEGRMALLYNWRLSWWQHWRLLAKFILPRRYKFVITANTQNRGLPINEDIIDSTGTLAMRICAGGMMSGLTSPSRPWFKIRPRSTNTPLDHEAAVWLDEAENLIYAVLAKSNFYDSLSQMYEDLVVFGTAPMLIYEDERNIITCYNPCAGEYFLGVGNSFRIETFYRRFVMTVIDIVEMFGLANCPVEVSSLWAEKGASLETEFIIAHAIEPNFRLPSSHALWPEKFTFREAYWLWGIASQAPLSIGGFDENPGIYPRWATTANDAYGRSPGMDVLGDAMQLQVMTVRKAEAIEKQVRPPMLAHVSLKNEPSSIAPGHVTYSPDMTNGAGMRPIYQVNPQLGDMTNDIMSIQNRIQRGFFNDLFLMLAETDPAKRMTATEVAARQQEKLQVLGPVIERLQNEALAPAIARVVAIMQKKKMFPPLPASLQAQPLQIDFVSMLSLAQKAAATAGMEQLAAITGSLGAVKPEVLDNLNGDEFVRTFASMLLVPQKVLNSVDQVDKMRKARAEAEAAAAEQAEALQMGGAMVEGAKTLSETPIGGGISALQAMLPGGSP